MVKARPDTLKSDKDTVYVTIDGPKDGSGKTPFTVFMWVDWTPSIQKPHWKAQCFKANIDEHINLIPGRKTICRDMHG